MAPSKRVPIDTNKTKEGSAITSTIRQCLGAATYTPQLMQQEFSQVPAKQIHRWEGEGGFIPPETLHPH